MSGTILRIWFANAVCASAQVITTIAGTNFSFPNAPLPALNAPLGEIDGVAVDIKGNVYLKDAENKLALRISPDGILVVVAGNGLTGFSGDGGPATSAALSLNGGRGMIAVDSAGDFYISDESYIRKVSGGIITTAAGNGVFGF